MMMKQLLSVSLLAKKPTTHNATHVTQVSQRAPLAIRSILLVYRANYCTGTASAGVTA